MALPFEHRGSLVVLVGGRACALRSADVVEIMRPLPVGPILGAPPWLLGLSIVRGAPTPVLDLAALMGSARREHTSRFVSIRLGDRRAVLAVDSVVGVRHLDATELGAIPPLLSNSPVASAAAIGALDDRLLFVLDAARVVPKSLWNLIAESEASA